VRDAKAAATSPTVDAPWPAMVVGVTQLSYALETEHAYLWVRDASGIRATVLATTPGSIDRDLTTLAGAIGKRDPQQLDVLLANLSTVLLPAGALRDDSKTLEIVAEGRIAGVPFAGLILPGEPARRLIESRSIEMIGSLFDARARPRPKQARALGFLALANEARPSADLRVSQVFPELHAVNSEAHAIEAIFRHHDPAAQAKLLLGVEGSASNFSRAWHDGADVIHIATHGIADPRQPQASLLLLPALDTAGNATYLTAGQVQEWRGDVDLVFLSACETAVGPSRFAEGLPGLQRAFLRAGSRAVIATLWSVEDVYASQFAADFYRRYFGGMRASQALSEAQRAWIAPVTGLSVREQGYRRMTAWAHAIYTE
jgi:CHAT domain-containing protein